MSSLPRSWIGTARHPDLGDLAYTGEVSLTSADLVFETEGQRVALPQRRLQFGHGAEGGLVFRDPEQDGWEICLPDEDILRHPAFHRLPVLVRQMKALRAGAETRRTLRLCAAFLLVFAVVAAALVAAGPVAVRLAVQRVPPGVETKVGEAALRVYCQARSMRPVDDPRAWARLAVATNALGPVLARTGWPWRFHILADRWPGGMAFPGGHVVVTTGLLDWVETPEELAGVLAHEMAHITRRHGLQQTIASQGPLMILQFALGERQEIVSELLEASAALAAFSFSRNQEREADALGFQYLVEAGVDPRGMLRFFVRLEEAERGARATFHRALGRTVDELAGGGDRFSTHPLTTERIARLEAAWERLSKKDGFRSLAWPAASPGQPRHHPP